MSDTATAPVGPTQTPTTEQQQRSGGGSGAVHPASSGSPAPAGAVSTPVVSPSKPPSITATDAATTAATAAATAAAASDLEQRIIHSALLMRGKSFLKFGRTGRPHLDVVRLSLPAAPAGGANPGAASQGQAVMMWGKKSVPLSELIAVTPGRVGPVFERFDSTSGVSPSELETLSSLSFSMVFSTRSLDLQVEYTAKKASLESVARAEAERNAWVAACKWLLTTVAAAGPQGAVAATILAPSPAHHAQHTPSQPSTPATPNPLLRATSQPSTPNLSASASAGTPPRNPDFSSASHLDSSAAGSPLHALIVSPSNSAAQSITPFSPAVSNTHGSAAALASSTAGASTSASAVESASGISRPLNVIRTTHVQSGFLWQRERLDEDFQLVRKLGEGAFAEVWLGRHKVLGFAVAVKTILLSSDPKRAAKEKEEIADEIAVLRLCRNKFICGYVGCCLTPDKAGRIWILMDFYSRGSILNLTFQAGMRLNESQISYVIHSVLMGLIYLNSRNICHRDVKGRNILCNDRGEIALADFGVSKILRHGVQGAGVAANATVAAPSAIAGESPSPAKDGPNMGNIAGSPCFMSPEVVSGSPASFAADIWSLGITCLELANGGRVPHDDLTTPYRIFRAIKTTVPTLDWTPTTPLPSGTAPPPLVLSPTTTPGGAFGAAPVAPTTAVWSHSFHDFVRLCLDPNPATRSDAVSLLSHPFVSGSFSPAVMAPILKAFDAAEHKRAKAQAKKAAMESKQQQTARPTHSTAASSSAAASRSPARPSILDSLFKFLGRKGPTSVQAKMQVQILQGAGTLDEMDDPAPPASAGKGAAGSDSHSADAGGAGDGTVVINGGSDTMVMGGDSFDSGCTSSDTDEEDDMHTAVTSLAPTPSISIAPSPASSPMATAAVMLPSYAAVPEIPAAVRSGSEHPASAAATAAAASAASPSSSASLPASSVAEPVLSLSSSSLSLSHVDSSSSLASPSAAVSATSSAGLPPSGLGHRKSHSNSGNNLAAAGAASAASADVLLKCSSAQLAALCHEVGIDWKLASALVARAASKFGTNVVGATSPALGARRAGGAASSLARRSQQPPQQQPQQSSPAPSLGRASPLTLDDTSDDHDAESPPSLFPGCTPNLALSESLITQLEYATVMVCGLSRNDLTALKRMTNAPAPVRMAIESVALVLGVAPYHVGGPAVRKIGSRARPVYDYWSSAQNVLTRPNFLTQLKSFDFRQLSPLIIDRLHEFGRLQPKEFTPEVVASASMPAGVLWAWTRSIYSYATLCLGYVPSGVAVDLANGNGVLEVNALTLPANEEVITAGTIAAAGAAGTSNSGALTGRSSSTTHTASTLSLLSPSAAQAGKLNRRGSAGALDPAVMAAATKLAAASAAAAAGGGANGGSTHRRGTGGHGSQPTIAFSAGSLLAPTAAAAKDSVAAPAAVMPLTSPVSAPPASGSSGGGGGAVTGRSSLGSGAKPAVRPNSAVITTAPATKAPVASSINVPAAAAPESVSASVSTPSTPATPNTDAAAAASASPASSTAAAAASKSKKTATGEVVPPPPPPSGPARRRLSGGGGGGGGGGSGRSLLVPTSGAATARSTSASRAPKSGSTSHKAKATTATNTAANSGAATTRDRGSSASAASSSAVPGKRTSLPPTHSKASTAASTAATASAAPKKA